MHAVLIGMALPGPAFGRPGADDDERAYRDGGESMLESLASATDRYVRQPMFMVFAPVLRTFRVSQLWYLYADGPDEIRRLEVFADGVLLFRSVDPAHAWLAGQFQNRRVRPVVESTCSRRSSPNWKGLGRYVAGRVRAEWPDTRTVELRCTIANFPGDDATTHHAFMLAAPDWEPAPL